MASQVAHSIVSRNFSTASTTWPSTSLESESGPGTYMPWSAPSTVNTCRDSRRASVLSQAGSAVPPTSRNGAVVLSSAATAHGTVSNGVSHTAGNDRSAASAAAFVPNDFAINNGAPPIASSSGVTSVCTHASTSGSNGFGGSSDQEYLCTVAPRRSATSPQYINKGAAGPYNRPGITTASATSATLRQWAQNQRLHYDPHARASLVIGTVDLLSLERADLPG